MLTEADICLRLFIAAILGAIAGFERERHNQPAGLRTHTILAIGSALAMCASIDLAVQYKNIAANGDPARLAAQVISGIGFLGAGAIIRYGVSIKGLTTATSLWTVAIVGLAVGAGHFYAGVTATLLLLGTLVLLDKLEKQIIVGVSTRTFLITAGDSHGFLRTLKETLEKLRIEQKSISFVKNVPQNEISVRTIIKIREQHNMDHLIAEISQLPDVKTIGVE